MPRNPRYYSASAGPWDPAGGGLRLSPGGYSVPGGRDLPFTRDTVARGLAQCYRSYRDLYVQTGEHYYLKLALDYVMTGKAWMKEAGLSE